ncbi:hypothetical protein LSH36_227g03010 [Paralvinella palmiformis]|uniref:Uncharacterized protein n=1 Tax=Paralvinella palmiformis TaxID=53620 RepID=A0AAD9N3M1_9ANNE|nr:hypothetical protein LSH36_227g03010 [Paralvinella palmiformis]
MTAGALLVVACGRPPASPLTQELEAVVVVGLSVDTVREGISQSMEAEFGYLGDLKKLHSSRRAGRRHTLAMVHGIIDSLFRGQYILCSGKRIQDQLPHAGLWVVDPPR